MSNEVQEVTEQKKTIAPWVEAMQRAEPKFIELAETHKAVTWKAEANYARQLIQKNDRLLSCTGQSIMDAIINVGAIGLSLSPAEKLAYLVPRGNVCSLDISYMGLIKLATHTGMCEYIRADLVREHDSFTYKGPAERALFSTSNPFDPEKRGDVVGVYAEARLPSGRYFTEIMNMDDIKAVMNTSKAKSGPWLSFFGEMARKTVVKRLAKTIPHTDSSGRLDQAIHVVNEHEGLEDAAVMPAVKYLPKFTPDHAEQFKSAIEDGDNSVLWHMSRLHRDDSVWMDLHSAYLDTAPDRKKGEYRKRIDTLTNAGRDVFVDGANQLADAMQNQDISAAIEILSDFEGQRSTLDEQIENINTDILIWLEDEL